MFIPRETLTDPRAYEEECVDAVTREFRAPGGVQTWLQETGRRLVSVGLRGEHPNTELVVRIADRRRDQGGDQVREHVFDLWGSAAILGQDTEKQPAPGLMGANIFTWVMEE